MKPKEEQARQTLREIELEVETEGREWMRHRLQAKPQAEANRVGGVFPPERPAAVASAEASAAMAHTRRRRRR